MERSGLYYILLFILPFAGVLLATPIISKFASYKNIVDKPGLHKTHKESTPLLGGVSIFLCFAAVLATGCDNRCRTLFITKEISIIKKRGITIENVSVQ